jgi:hypothetical protein
LRWQCDPLRRDNEWALVSGPDEQRYSSRRRSAAPPGPPSVLQVKSCGVAARCTAPRCTTEAAEPLRLSLPPPNFSATARPANDSPDRCHHGAFPSRSSLPVHSAASGSSLRQYFARPRRLIERFGRRILVRIECPVTAACRLIHPLCRHRCRSSVGHGVFSPSFCPPGGSGLTRRFFFTVSRKPQFRGGGGCTLDMTQ